ncbi:hypothetical protein L211DRAFT_777730 [Terfezia boudieri ATCC MYA-4762]|uniref:Uncharacterized protein n=1 Tax=Terfezia boudieri ATCC MYA-4762 TaxID=1051890 RepID=A0A3N4M781_9PEZI|nr:hypothetical protein L211DRAFT_777730 [Terfezia boudieri ATCC MYA-4762]
MTLTDLHSTAILVEEMLALAGYNPDQDVIEAIKTSKEELYKGLARCLRIEGHETLMEANVNDLVVFIIHPTIDEFRQRTGRKTIQLFREKQLMAEDEETGEYEEFVVVDRIEITVERYLLIIEAKRDSLGAAMGQCLLAMKYMGDSNHRGIVYGFVTTGDSWRMLRYDASDGSFLVTDMITAVFDTMGRHEEKWMRECSVIVDCVYAALGDGGIVEKKDVVVG